MRASTDVAIIGMACLFPGAPNLQAYWQNIVTKVDAVSEPPPEWGAEEVFDPQATANDRLYCKRGGFLKDLARFDPLAYGVMPRVVDGGEPEHFLALRVAHEALADAGYLERPFNRERAAVILGRGTFLNRGSVTALQHGLVVDQTLRLLKQLHPEYSEAELQALRQELKASLPPFNAETAPGLVSNVMCGRIANRLDLHGPNYAVDAACASSLIAVDLGMRELLSGRCDLVLAGGVNVSTPPIVFMVFCQLGALSRRGQIRPFDRDADGTLLGEGLGIVVLKRLEDAERDGDRIYAVLKGVGIASDGRGLAVLAPRVEGEELALRRAYEAAGISPRSVELIEAHGTGTPVGDATEIEALSRVFGPRSGPHPWCALGSVKSMISHTIPAAGIAGLIKAALALYHKVLPPTLHCETPNPKLALDKTPFYLNTELRPWIHGGPEPRRAGVNAFGFGGINAHAILEEYPAQSPQSESYHWHWESELCLLQGETRQSLIEQGEQLARYLASHPEVALKDLAYTLNCPLQAGTYRLAIVASSPADLQKKLAHALQRLADPHCTRIKDRSGIFFFAEPLRRQGSLAFLFPGEGAQYVNMLADLCCHFPEVRTCFDQADQVFLHNGRPLPPSRVVFPPPPLSSTPETAHEGELWQMDYAVATVFTANYALYKLLTALGIRPQAVVGHSSGELTALLAAGALAVDDERQLMEHGLALNALYHTLAEQTPAALLLAVGGAAPEAVAMVVAESKGEIFVAMDNCPHQVVLCGPEAAIVHAQEALQRQGALCRLLPFHRAYHTPLFQPVCEQLVHFFERLRLGPPHIPLYSCATAQPYPAEPAAIGRLAAEQWARPVRFRETIEAMYAAGVRLFVEVGPRGNLTSFVEDILRQRPHLAVPANVAHRSGLVQLHTLLGLLAAHGVEMDLEPLYRRRSPQRLSFTATSPQPASRAAQRIALELPQLRLNPERRTPAAAPVLPAPRLSQPPATGAMPPPNGTAREQGQGRMPVMHGYFQTMARFLQLQQEVMQSFMARQRQASSVSLAALPAAAPNPFSLTVTAGVAGQELVATCVLDPARHLFLRHHTIGGAPSRLDASRVALPVVPLAMMVEIMAQAAALLFPAQRLLACKQVKAYRWMVVEDAPRAFLLQVKRAGHEPVADVTLWETQEGTRPGALLAEGRMVFGTTYPEPPPSAPFSLRAARPYRFSPDQYYREVMFHGPAFRSVRAIARWGEDGIEATVSVPAAEPLFREPAPLLTNPVLLDAAGQAVGFWAADGLAQGFVVFPVGFAELAFYGPPPAGSVPLTCRARTAVLPDRRLRSQIEFVNAEGRVLLRFTDWEDLRFDFPRSLVRFVLSPQDHMLSTPWPAPRQPLPAGVQCCRLDGFPGPLASDALWARAWARLILSRQEYETWNQLGGSAARCQEWLLGRLVAKDAVRLLLRQRYGWSLCPADVELDVDAHGQPRLVGPLAEKVAPPVLISIAHAGGRAAALAVLAEGTRGIGLDIEPLERHPELERLALTAPERAWLEALPADKAKEWVLRLWCAKEAAAKALGCGLAGNPLWFETQAWDEDAGTVTVVLAEPLRQRLPAYLPARLFAYTGRDGNLVFASVLV